jgi:hypothetical protein
MGRKKLYVTKKQKRESKRKDDRLYYERHKERIKQKRMEDYWRKKEVDKKMSEVSK